MRNIKPYRQWFLQTPILFCSGSLVYLGWPYLALLVQGCLSVLVFICSSNIDMANVRQKLADKGHSKDEVVMFSEQFAPLVLECENNLSAILSTHDDALDTLAFLIGQLLIINAQNSKDISLFLKKQPEIIRNRQQKVTNPVSSVSMSSEEVDLF